jgi:uncharacterized protein YbbC (DUF1343 family)
VRLGIDRFFERDGARGLRGRRVAVLCHHASRDAVGRHLLARLAAEGVTPALVLGPEHGLWGVAQDMESVDSARDPVFGCETQSLYGSDVASLGLPPDRLGTFDVLLADLQDVGARYYTYAATLLIALEQLSGRGVRVVVLDRPNPIGRTVEGNHVASGFRSFVGYIDLPNRHGLTLGETARLHVARLGLDVDLEVAAVDGWTGDAPSADALGFFWPSPNLPDPETALLYPGLCLVEGTELSEGRGTTKPFRLVGAPWVDADDVVRRLAAYGQPGLRALPYVFRPMFQKHAGQVCRGVFLQVTDPATFRPWEAGLCLLAAFRASDPERFAWRTRAYEFVTDRPAIDLLLGDDRLRPALEAGADPRDLAREAVAAAGELWAECAPILLYPR